ncbi:glycosyltransferase family 2 protein [Prochlorococcus marinus]|uniref:Possible glycosyl transferase n=1 Tax=Prochlorococcus marinus (strain AS9601) TaxID=146891 RepID=A2BSB6_PROMS|nr:glycosyltransferase family A protein [Prochlorococcus marinus]ABM70677.1 possible glycosyl transferase [Prochlorococcus marinus str. AS9601]
MVTNLVTCAFTTFNSSDSIEMAIRSAFNQDYVNIEIIIVDDYSSDNTIKILLNLSNNSPFPFRIISNKKNMGIGYCRDVLLNESNGEFIAFFDDDDFSYKNRISNQLSKIREFEKESNINIINFEKSPLCYCNRYLRKSEKKILVKSIYADFRKISNKKTSYALLSCGHFPIKASPGSTATCVLFARLKTLRSLGGFNHKLRRFEDLDIAVKAAINNISMISTESILLDQYVSYGEEKKDSLKYELLLLEENKNYLDKRQYNFAKDYINFKNYCFSFRPFLIIKYFIKFSFGNPLLFIKKFLSSFRTIILSIKYKDFSENI